MGSLPIHGEASAKAALYRDRFLLLFQRVSRDQHFSRPSFDVENSEFGSCEVVLSLSLSLSLILFCSAYLHMKNMVLFLVLPRFLQFNLWLGKRGEDG